MIFFKKAILYLIFLLIVLSSFFVFLSIQNKEVPANKMESSIQSSQVKDLGFATTTASGTAVKIITSEEWAAGREERMREFEERLKKNPISVEEWEKGKADRIEKVESRK